MCGIFGAVGEFSPDKVKLLGLLNRERGKDSCGFFNETQSVKCAFSVLYELDQKIFDEKSRFIVGHTRLATCGKISQKNAHPFTYGKITGVHNGIIHNWEEFKDSSMEVDSEVIFKILHKEGPEGLNDIYGTMSIVWSDKTNPDVLYLLRRSNPLYIAKGEKAIYFSSEALHLRKASVLPEEIKERRLYTINLNTLDITKEKVKGMGNSYYNQGWERDLEDYEERIQGSAIEEEVCVFCDTHYPLAELKLFDPNNHICDRCDKAIEMESEPKEKEDATPLAS